MAKPQICINDSKLTELPVHCDDTWWLVKVETLSAVDNPSRDHAYMLPDQSIWVLSYDERMFIQLSSAEGGNGPTVITNDDGFLTIEGNGSYHVKTNLNQDAMIRLIQKHGRQTDWQEKNEQSAAYIKNKPDLSQLKYAKELISTEERLLQITPVNDHGQVFLNVSWQAMDESGLQSILLKSKPIYGGYTNGSCELQIGFVESDFYALAMHIDIYFDRLTTDAKAGSPIKLLFDVSPLYNREDAPDIMIAERGKRRILGYGACSDGSNTILRPLQLQSEWELDKSGGELFFTTSAVYDCSQYPPQNILDGKYSGDITHFTLMREYFNSNIY